jgi:hypothetical protein
MSNSFLSLKYTNGRHITCLLRPFRTGEQIQLPATNKILFHCVQLFILNQELMYKGEEHTSKFRLNRRMMDGTCTQMENLL